MKLKVQEAKYYKLGFDKGLTISGVEDGKPQWFGNSLLIAQLWRDYERLNKF